MRVLAERHAGDVQQPTGFKVAGGFAQRFRKTADSGARAALIAMNSTGPDRKNARFGTVVEQAIGLLAQAQLAKSDVHQEIGAAAMVHRATQLLHLFFELLIRGQGFGRITRFQKLGG